jgi:V8-like Glu-specific endopeptidase
VIKQSLTSTTDFALVRLDRPVVGVSPVKIAKTPAQVGTSLVMIGHPSGLPQKITDDAVVKSVSATEFKASLDAFQINSGSAVFNAKSGELLGILVRGLMDYRTNPELGCTEVNTATKEAVGEDVASFTQFIDYLK